MTRRVPAAGGRHGGRVQAAEAQSSIVNRSTLLAPRPWLGTLARLLLGAIWIWAALSKIGSPRTFTQAVRAYQATPEWLSKAIGYGLPVLELCLGVLLVLGIVVRLAAIVSAVLLAVFLIGIIEVAARGIQLDCGCFGGGGLVNGGTRYPLDILRDIGLLIVAGFLVYRSATRISLEEFLARNDYVEPPSAKRLRNDQGRRKYEAQVAERERNARVRAVWLNSALAVVVALIALVGIGVQDGRAKIQGTLTATNASVANGVVFGKPAAATVDIYEDFQCSHCLAFEKAVGATLDADVRANKVQARFHPMSFLDSASSGNRYSSRAADAALCASDVSVDAFVAYHNVLYGTFQGQQVQPAEGGTGRSDDQLVSYAATAGITGAKLTTFDSCVRAQTHLALVQAITEKASASGINATPTVKVNGKSISPTLSAFDAAVAAALKNGPAPSPSVTPASSAPASSPAPSVPTTGSPAATSPASPSATSSHP